MFGLVENQVVELTPAPSTGGVFRVEVVGPDSKGRGRLFVLNDGRILESGVLFYKRGELTVDPRTGAFMIAKGVKAAIRAVFAGQHRDVEIKRKA